LSWSRSIELALEVPPEAAEPCTLEDDELGLLEPDDEVEPCGHEQFSAGPLEDVEPEALD
jgi:hypothetical protein